MTRPAPGRHARPRTPLGRRAAASPAGAAALGAFTVASLLAAGTAQAATANTTRPLVLSADTGGAAQPNGSVVSLPTKFAASTQLITVQTSGSDATVTAWQRTSAGWVSEFSTTGARIGANGVTDGTTRTQGTNTTPSGTYTITQGFGVGVNPGTEMPYHRVTSADWWVEDPSSKYYNQLRTAAQGGFPLTEAGDHGSEHLINYPTQYNNALVINFNMNPAVPGRGAGIFLHDLGPQKGPTAGCVALPAAVMTQIMRWIDPAQHPVITIAAPTHHSTLSATGTAR